MIELEMVPISHEKEPVLVAIKNMKWCATGNFLVLLFFVHKPNQTISSHFRYLLWRLC